LDAAPTVPAADATAATRAVADIRWFVQGQLFNPTFGFNEEAAFSGKVIQLKAIVVKFIPLKVCGLSIPRSFVMPEAVSIWQKAQVLVFPVPKKISTLPGHTICLRLPNAIHANPFLSLHSRNINP
jgi:hypothetical protein